MPDEKKPDPVDGDAHYRIVRGFRIPDDAYPSQAKIKPGQSVLFAIFLSRHSRRARRNKFRETIAKNLALWSRSEEAYGSKEAADVAKLRVSATASGIQGILDKEIAAADEPEDTKKGGEA